MISAIASSTTERVLENGALNTATPRAAAAARSIWLVPMQNAPIATRSGAASSTFAVTWVLERMPSRWTPSRALDQLVLVERAGVALDVEAGSVEDRASERVEVLQQQGLSLGTRPRLPPGRRPRAGGRPRGHAPAWSCRRPSVARASRRVRPVRRTSRSGRSAVAAISSGSAPVATVPGPARRTRRRGCGRRRCALARGHQAGGGEARVCGHRGDRQAGRACAPVELEGEQQVRTASSARRRATCG